MTNRELFQRDPVLTRIENDGTARVNEGQTKKEIDALRFELEHFVCEGQYEDGLIRIIESYLNHFDAASQPAAWVSGFYGSGKSHLLKMLRHLWIDTTFEDGATARGLATLSDEVRAQLRDLDVHASRHAGKLATAATLPSGGGESVRIAILKMLNRAKGLPASLPQARFSLHLQRNGLEEAVRTFVHSKGKDFDEEIASMYVSPVISEAILYADPNFASGPKEVRSLLKEQYPREDNIATDDFVRYIRNLIAVDKQIPCTVIVLDEIQLFIGSDDKRSTEVQEAAEALCKELDSRILVIGAGQSALASEIPQLNRFKGRFTVTVELSDTDVQNVTRKVVLAKRADRRKEIEKTLEEHVGEIDRQLSSTSIAARSEDRKIWIEDYPLLPVRRRFWELVLRAVDEPGTASQLRTQLKIVYEAVHTYAERELGTVVPADFIFDQLQPDLVRTNVLLREVDETIQKLNDGTADGRLKKRLCSLVFLIRKLPRDPAVDSGVRATAGMLADLMVDGLDGGGSELRNQIPMLLETLLEETILIKIDDEFSLQTRESAEWEKEYRNRLGRLKQDISVQTTERSHLLRDQVTTQVGSKKVSQGKAKVPRKLLFHYGDERPKESETEITAWVRDGWDEKESNVLLEARQDGSSSPLLHVFIPRLNADTLNTRIREALAARQTLDFKGSPSSVEGKEARAAMESRMRTALMHRDELLAEILDRAKVYLGGGTEVDGIGMSARLDEAARASATRLFPQFATADDDRWARVITQVRQGNENALQLLGWKQSVHEHPVCKLILKEIGGGKDGKQIRELFERRPYGWPRDAIDGVLMTLFASGQLRARYKGKPLTSKELDQGKISVTEFTQEHAVVETKQLLVIRKLLTDMEIPFRQKEESQAIPGLCEALESLVQSAGGAPPLPTIPETELISAIRGSMGNAQLLLVCEHAEELHSLFETWYTRSVLAAERMIRWQRLIFLRPHFEALEGSGDILQAMDAIENDRNLLDDPSPLPDLEKRIAKILRTALNEARTACLCEFEAGMAFLNADDAWHLISEEQRTVILQRHSLTGLPEIQVGSIAEIHTSITSISLEDWQLRTDALNGKFSQARLEATRLMQPATQHVKVSSGVLQTPAELDVWLEITKKTLAEEMKKGPIVIG